MTRLLSTLATGARIGAESLRLNPLRTALSTLGVVIGVAALVSVLSLGDGMERSARSQLRATTPVLALDVSSRTTESAGGEVFPLPDTLMLDAGDAAALRRIHGVAALSLNIEARREVRTAAGVRRMALVRGTDVPLAPESTGGRLPGRTGATDHPVPVVLLEPLARGLDANDPQRLIGSEVTVAGEPAVVVGVRAPIDGEPATPALELPFAQAVRLFGGDGRTLPRISVTATTIEDVPRVQAAIERHLAARRSDWRTRFAVSGYRARAEQAAQGILIFKLLMGALTGISLLVGGIGIMNVLLASVSERTREIGIRRASGARRGDILLQFLSESVAIAGLGSVLGIALGLATSFAATAAIRRFAAAPFVQASFSWNSVLSAAVIAVLVGVAFGSYPARRAARLSPIDAIRHE